MADNLQGILTEDGWLDGVGRTQLPMLVTNPNLDDNPIVYVNQAFTRQTGYARSSVIGRNCRFLQGEGTDIKAVDQIRKGIKRHEPTSVDILNYRASGEAFMNRLTIAPLLDDHGNLQYFVGIQKELRPGEHSESAERIDEQLMEIQSRVATDISLIIGMVRRQSGSTSVPSEFKALTRRIETLQLLHDEMALADRQSEHDIIHMGSYLSRLASAISHIHGHSGIRLNFQFDPVDVPIEIASRVGLVVSEILTNSFQHAFDRMDTGLIEVRMSQLSGGGFRVTVSDDGIGIPKTVAWPNPNTLGGRIMNGLIEGMEGTLHLVRGAAGSFVTIDVPAGATITTIKE
jgi:PAS domain S-box-containing protein